MENIQEEVQTKRKLNMHWTTVENKYEDTLKRMISLHEQALKAIEEIQKERLFENIDGSKIKRTKESKILEISELVKRFVLSKNVLKWYKFSIRNKTWRRKNMQTWSIGVDNIE